MSQVLSVGVMTLQRTLSPQVANSEFSEFYVQGFDKYLTPEDLWLVPPYVFEMNATFKNIWRRLNVCTYVVCSNTKRFLIRNNTIVHRTPVVLENCDVGFQGQFLVAPSVAATMNSILEKLNLRTYDSTYNGFMLDNTNPDLIHNFNILYKIVTPSEEGTPDDCTWVNPENLLKLLSGMDRFSQIIPMLASKMTKAK